MEGRFLGNQVPIQAQIAAARHVDAAFAMKPHLCTMDHITSIMLSNGPVRTSQCGVVVLLVQNLTVSLGFSR
ncbi:hypothetical protein, partial [uncultured Ralstonia sp.]|uniref:hypothetical protein n=1 Tax=uncultured Ralstonia sp. TaxID=114715 RepID=UPI0025F2F5B7